MRSEVSVREAAIEFGVHTRTIRKWCASGRLHTHKVNDAWRIDAADVYASERLARTKQIVNGLTTQQAHKLIKGWPNAKLLLDALPRGCGAKSELEIILAAINWCLHQDEEEVLAEHVDCHLQEDGEFVVRGPATYGGVNNGTSSAKG